MYRLSLISELEFCFFIHVGIVNSVCELIQAVDLTFTHRWHMACSTLHNYQMQPNPSNLPVPFNALYVALHQYCTCDFSPTSTLHPQKFERSRSIWKAMHWKIQLTSLRKILHDIFFRKTSWICRMHSGSKAVTCSKVHGLWVRFTFVSRRVAYLKYI